MKRPPLLDLLVARFPGTSRERLMSYILAGEVLVDGELVRDPHRKIPVDVSIDFKGERFVSRGGLKLDHAIAAWSLPVEGRVFIDAGASTGGFTDCLLQRGAAAVHAVDVGYNQLAYSLRRDPRVIVHERTNIMHVSSVDPPAHAAVCDLSFRSAVGAARHLRGLLTEGWVVALVKPQFEVDPDTPGFDGVVRDGRLLRDTLDATARRLAETGMEVFAAVPSPILGRRGNREFLFLVGRAVGNVSSGQLRPLEVVAACLSDTT